MKKTVKLLSVVLALMLMVSMLAVAALADPVALENSKAKFTTTFTYTGSIKPTRTFTYTISNGVCTSEADSVDTTGYFTGTPTIGSAEFVPADFDADTTASKEVEVDFSGVTFNVPGTYEYTITQVAPENAVAGLTLDANATRTLVVIVSQTATGITYSYVLDGGAAKGEGFANSFDTCNLTVSKTVTGNQGDLGKYFKFTVTVTLPDGKVAPYEAVAVNGQSATPSGVGSGTKYSDDEMASANGVDSLTFNVLSGGKVFYLKHGQSLTITGIPKGVSYTVTEDNEGYTKTATGDSSTNMEADATAAFTNNKTGTVPTGVVMSLIPGAMLLVAGAAGIILRGRKKED